MAWLLMYNVFFAPTNGPVALFRADNEHALFPKSSDDFWDGYGIIRSFAAPYTPAHNNRAESAIRTTYMTARCVLRDSPVEDYFWPFAVDYACFLLVRRPTSAAPETTPYGRIMRCPPSLPAIAFGTLGHWTPPPQHPMQSARHTFSPRGFACHFLGFAANSETTMVIVSNGAIYNTIDVVFPRPGALLMTRDLRAGTTNYTAAGPVTHREEPFLGLLEPSAAATASSLAARPAATLEGRLYHHAAHDLDCGLCDKHTAKRMLLCCEFCPAVAHIRCAGLTRVPEDQWVCASCKAGSLPAPAVPRVTIGASLPPMLAAHPPDSAAVQSAGGDTPPGVAAPPASSAPTSPLAPVDDVVTSHSVDCQLPLDHPGVCRMVSSGPGVLRRERMVSFRPARPPASDSSDCDEPLPLSAALVTVPRALQRLPLRLGLLCSPAHVATALASITGARHLREPAAAFRDLRGHPAPYPVQLNETFGESEVPRLSGPGLRELQPLLPSPLAMKTGGDSMRLARLHGFLRLGNPPAPDPAPVCPVLPTVSKDSSKVNPLCYPLFACAADGVGDAGCSRYDTAVGYDDAKPRLGQGFQYDSKRLSRGGMTMKEALATDHAAKYLEADLRERDVLLSTGSLKPVKRGQQKGYQITYRHLCSFKPHKVGDKQFDSRLCLHGFRQRASSYDPDRVSTPVAKTESVKLSMAWAAGRDDCDSEHADGDRAFLQASLTSHDGDMWVEPPANWGFPPDTVLQVMNSVYGLKQSCYNWCEKLDGVLMNGGCVPFLQDPRSFILANYRDGKMYKTFIHAHVDDVKIIGMEVDLVRAMIAKHIKITCKGPKHKTFCGLEFEYAPNGVVLIHMRETIDSLMALCKASGVNLEGLPCPNSPMLPGVAHELMRNYATEPAPNDKFYRSVCGLCIWAECGVRVDISFALGVLTSALGKNTPAHDTALLRLVLWLRGNASHGLVYGGDVHERARGFMGWMDSSFADAFKAKSTQGYAIKFNGCLVKWNSRRQQCVALDTMEAEYVSASAYCRALLGMLNLLMDMLLEQGPVITYEDNSAASGLITQAPLPRGARHINVRHHFVRELQQLNIIDVRQCTTDQQQADLLTKALDPGKFSINLAALSFLSIEQFHAKYG